MAKYTDGLLGDVTLGLSLDRYQEIMQLPIAAFNGLNWPEEDPKHECATIWTQANRDNLAMWIAAAEERRETELNYHLAPKWLEAEEHTYAYTILLDKKLLIQPGILVETLVGEDVALTLSPGGNIQDPVEFTVDIGSAANSSDVVVTYADDTIQLTPSSITMNGNIATIKIPRSRLVKPELMDNRADHLYYSDDNNFITEVDVWHHTYTLDGAIQFVWSSAQVTCEDGCNEKTSLGCYTQHGNKANRISKIQVWPATYTDGVPSSSMFPYTCPPWMVRVSYLSGKQNSMNTQLLTARLAHTMMPNEPCSCPYVEQYWQTDRQETDIYTGYGSMKGAVEAWTTDHRQRVGSGGMLASLG